MKIVKLTAFLSVVGGVIAIILFTVNALTAPIIEKNNQIKTKETLIQLVGTMDGYDNQVVNQGPLLNVYRIKQGGKETAVVLDIKTFGFQSEIEVLVLIKDGNYEGFAVVQQAETAGYGTKIVDDTTYTDQFKHHSIKDRIDTISGSTVTSSHVNKAIEEAVKIYESLK